MEIDVDLSLPLSNSSENAHFGKVPGPPESSRLHQFGENISLLLVDDDFAERAICRRLLNRISTSGFVLQECATAEAALIQMETRQFSCVLLDLNLPMLSGIELLGILTERFEVIPPVVVLTGDTAEAGVSALKAGALDYLHKDQLTSDALERAICFAIEKGRARQLRRRLDVSERVAALGSLAAGVAHEINNPAAYLTSNLETASRLIDSLENGLGRSPPDQLRPLVQQLRQLTTESSDGVHRIATIVSDLRQFTNFSPNAVKPTTLTHVARTALRLFRPRQANVTQLELALNSAVEFNAEEGKLVQIVLNLLSNAVAAVPSERPRLKLTTRDTPTEQVLELEDNGPGLDVAQRERVFVPFFTTKPAGVGSGLGLALSLEYAVRHRGRLEVERSPSLGGALFKLSIPRQTGINVIPEPQKAPAPAKTPKSRILVVDDEPIIRSSLERLLSEQHEVLTAANKSAALALIEQHAFDVILCDMTLGEVRGTEIYTEVSSLHPELAQRFVFWSGGDISEAEHEVISKPGCQLLSKPIKLSGIQDAVAKVRALDAKEP